VELGCEFRIVPSTDAQAEVPAADQVRSVHLAITDLLTRHAVAPPAQERRTHPRVPFRRAVGVEAEDWPEPVTGYARDLSKGGMSLIARMALPPLVTVVFVPYEGATPLRIRARVVRCNRIRDGFFDVGLQFLRLDAPAG
jgi:hypothetical protein